MIHRRWLLRHDVAELVRRAMADGFKASAEQQAAFASKRAAAEPENYAIVGDTAQIAISGILTETPDFWAWLLYGANTAYEDIRTALALAAANPGVARVELLINSPGGEVSGLFQTVDALAAFPKAVSVRASLAASAAYGLAAASGGPIEAMNRASEFGSIGVATSFYTDPNVVDIASTNAPDKRPDVTTPEGQAVVRRELDALHALFVDAIASGRTRAGRPTTADQINAEFGRGAVLLADEAQRRGMIDSLPAKAAPAKRAEKKDSEMTKEELKAQHPAVYAAVLEEGKNTGAKDERDRVCAHLELGEACGDLKIALAAVRSGDGLTQTMTAKYLAKGLARKDQEEHQQESNGAASATAGAKPADDGKDFGDKVADVLAARRGKAS